MLKNNRLEERRKKISKDIDIYVNHSFEIVDRIHEILLKQDKEQKDLAKMLGKSESEISKWMTGTHNFTLKTIAKIEAVLGETIIKPTVENIQEKSKVVYLQKPDYPMSITKISSRFPANWNSIISTYSQNTFNGIN
jgi:transcriptional regulator with XRE-family HTH domain